MSNAREQNEAEYARREAIYSTARDSECSVCLRQMGVRLENGQPVVRCQTDPTHEGYRKLRSLTQLAKEHYIPYVSERVQRKKEEQLEEQIQDPETRALAVYGTEMHLMTETVARRLVSRLWPKAKNEAVEHAILLAVQQNLNPLNHEIYIVPFKGEDVIILGIEANRKMARRRSPYTYLDGPRPLTASEVEDMGEDPKQRIGVICVLGTPGGARFPGYGFWPRNQEPYGADKGNTKFNMASYRAERSALKRLMPDAELPAPVGMVYEGVYADITEIVDAPRTRLSPPPTVRSGPPPATSTLKVDHATGEILTPPAEPRQPSQDGASVPASTKSGESPAGVDINDLIQESGLTLQQVGARVRLHFQKPGLTMGKLTSEQREWVIADLRKVIAARQAASKQAAAILAEPDGFNGIPALPGEIGY